MAKCTGKVCCLACCGITVVLLAVLIPVGIFVVAPKVAQKTLDDAPVSITNGTMMPCSTPYGKPAYAELIVTMDLTSSAPFAATLDVFNTTLSTYMCDGMQGANMCKNATEVVLGSFMSPKTNLKHGLNTIQQTVSMSVKDVGTLLSVFVLPLVGIPHKKVWLAVSGEDLSLSVFGLKVKKLHMRKEMTCQLMTTSHEVPDPKYCGPDAPTSAPDTSDAKEQIVQRRLQGGFAPVMNCTAGFSDIFSPTADLLI